MPVVYFQKSFFETRSIFISIYQTKKGLRTLKWNIIYIKPKIRRHLWHHISNLHLSPQDRDAIRWAAEQILNDRDFAAAVAQWHGEAPRNLVNQNRFHITFNISKWKVL